MTVLYRAEYEAMEKVSERVCKVGKLFEYVYGYCVHGGDGHEGRENHDPAHCQHVTCREARLWDLYQDMHIPFLQLKSMFEQDWDDAWIYAIQNNITGLVKIGFSISVGNRHSKLQCESGCKMTLLASFRATDAPVAESILHHRFWPYHVMGEWFRLDASHIAFLNSIYGIIVDGTA